MAPKSSWLVAQSSAREHYSVPRGMHRRRQLQRLYTGLWWRPWLPGPRAMRSCYHPELASANVTSFGTQRVLVEVPGIVRQFRQGGLKAARRGRSRRMGKWFGPLVAAAVRREQLDPDRHAFFGFANQSLETLELLAERDVLTIVDQPGADGVMQKIYREQMQQWPGWEDDMPAAEPAEAEYFQRRCEERERATLVLANSQWVRQAMLELGVPDRKIIVIPLAYEPVGEPPPPQDAKRSGLIVLWLANVSLAKGIPYFIEAARRLAGSDMQFLVVGPQRISQEVIDAAPTNMRWIGPIPRAQTTQMYRQAHVYVLPTLSDGFGLTQLEAMSQGLPVITTPRSGSVVTDGVDGLVVPACDSDALVQAIGKLDGDRALLSEMSRMAIEKSRQFTIDRYARQIDEVADAFREGRIGS